MRYRYDLRISQQNSYRSRAKYGSNYDNYPDTSQSIHAVSFCCISKYRFDYLYFYQNPENHCLQIAVIFYSSVQDVQQKVVEVGVHRELPETSCDVLP